MREPRPGVARRSGHFLARVHARVHRPVQPLDVALRRAVDGAARENVGGVDAALGHGDDPLDDPGVHGAAQRDLRLLSVVRHGEQRAGTGDDPEHGLGPLLEAHGDDAIGKQVIREHRDIDGGVVAELVALQRADRRPAALDVQHIGPDVHRPAHRRAPTAAPGDLRIALRHRLLDAAAHVEFRRVGVAEQAVAAVAQVLDDVVLVALDRLVHRRVIRGAWQEVEEQARAAAPEGQRERDRAAGP